MEQSETSRVEAFSDGVFAIAITLLILEVRVPKAAAMRSGESLWRALFNLWPSYIGYVLSFVTIGIMWANHHAIFNYIRKTDRYFLLLNLLLLMLIAFLPFPTAVVAEHLAEAGGRQAAMAFYSAILVGIALAFNALWWYAIAGDRLVGSAVHRPGLRTISRRYAMGPLSYGAAFGLAFLSAWASLALHLILALLYLLPERKPA